MPDLREKVETPESIVRELQYIRIGMLDHYSAALMLERLVNKAQALALNPQPAILEALGVREADKTLLDQALKLQAQVQAARQLLDVHEAAYLPYEKLDTQQGAYAGGCVTTARTVRKAMDEARALSTAPLSLGKDES